LSWTALWTSPPVRLRQLRWIRLPSRLAATASATMPPTSVVTSERSAESRNVWCAALTRIGWSSGSASLRWSKAVASALVIPPTSMPATVTPSAI
jgi:hypothetical protein